MEIDLDKYNALTSRHSGLCNTIIKPPPYMIKHKHDYKSDNFLRSLVFMKCQLACYVSKLHLLSAMGQFSRAVNCAEIKSFMAAIKCCESVSCPLCLINYSYPPCH